MLPYQNYTGLLKEAKKKKGWIAEMKTGAKVGALGGFASSLILRNKKYLRSMLTGAMLGAGTYPGLKVLTKAVQSRKNKKKNKNKKSK